MVASLQGTDELTNLLLWQDADKLGHHLAVLERNNRRHSRYAIRLCGLDLVVDVDGHKVDFLAIQEIWRRRESVQDWAEHLAWAAPVGDKVDEHGLIAALLFQELLETCA